MATTPIIDTPDSSFMTQAIEGLTNAAKTTYEYGEYAAGFLANTASSGWVMTCDTTSYISELAAPYFQSLGELFCGDSESAAWVVGIAGAGLALSAIAAYFFYGQSVEAGTEVEG